jgi:response regulator RpfG family c-di-GMP phosphodiesterase
VDSEPQSKIKVLFVDDEDAVLSSYERILAPHQDSYAVVTATSSEAALELLSRQHVDIIFADYSMPGMNGDAFFERVRNIWSHTLRILVTGRVDVGHEILQRSGLFSWIPKPFSPQQVLEVLDAARLEIDSIRDRLWRSNKVNSELHTFKYMFRSAGVPMALADLEGHVFEMNEAWISAANAESTSQALLRRPHILHPDMTLNWEEIKRVGFWSGELEHDGRIAVLTIATVRDYEGSPHAVAAIEKDITSLRKYDELTRNAQYSVILALARLCERRDIETGQHLERMRRYSRLLAEQLVDDPRYPQVDADYVEAIFISAPLHDIGKVGIPDSVLLKPGKLTAEEWEIMKTHTTIGAEVLSAVGVDLPERSWLAMAQRIAAMHHEKYDGSGYPAGLSGESIALAARIVALADAFDAITSRRVYKEAFSTEEAVARIVADSGKHFDPELVQVFLRIENQFASVAQHFKDDQ